MQARFVFERKENGDGWKEMTDDDFMVEMYKHYRKLSPVVREMLDGKIINMGNADYRIRHTAVEIDI